MRAHAFGLSHLLSLAFSFLAAPLFAQAASPLELREAVRLYDDGDYEAAAAVWRTLLEEEAAGLDRAVLHYNLGNAEFRNGRLGRAMLHWERTLLLRPGDDDALANLALARELLGRRLTETASSDVPDDFARELLRSMGGFAARFRRIPPGRFAAVLSAAALAAGSLGTLLLLGRRRRLFGFALLGCLLAAAGSGSLLWLRLGASPVAVVVEPGAALRSGPGASFPRLASLPEGFYLELGGSGGAAEDRFFRVLAAGIVGYADRESVAPVEE